MSKPVERTAQSGMPTNPAKIVKRKRSQKAPQPAIITKILSPQWSYLRLTLLTSGPSTTIDALALRSSLLQALSSYLGDHGAAIPIDILHLDEDVEASGIQRPSAYIRIQDGDTQAVVGALSSWSGSGSVLAIRVKSQSPWLANIAHGSDGQALFQMTVDDGLNVAS